MSLGTKNNHRSPQGRDRRVLWLALSGAGAALLLVLGVNGTLAGWTAAIIDNSTNTAGAADAVALAESDDGGATSCVDTATVSDGSNSATCTSINTFGGNTTMAPGDDEVLDVTFTNTGTGDATQFGYTAGTCVDTAGTLCSNGHLTVAVRCSAGAAYDAGAVIAALTNAAVAPGSLVPTTGAAVPIAAGDQVTCRFTTTLAGTAPASDSGASVSQPITWTLSA